MIYIFSDSKYFYQISRALSGSLTRLGVENEIVDNFDKDGLYIIFNSHTIPIDKLPKRYIIYNFEQIKSSIFVGHDYYYKLLKADAIWDYSLKNIEFLNKYNLKAKHLPFGYDPSLEVDLDNRVDFNNKGIGLLFLGGPNKRRYGLLSKLAERSGRRVVALVTESCFYEEWDRAVSNSRIAVNLHYYSSDTILEVSRIIPFIANKCLVVSERSDDKWYDDKFEGKVKFCDEETLVDIYYDCFENYDQMQEFIENSYQWLKNEFNYADLIKESGVLKDLH